MWALGSRSATGMLLAAVALAACGGTASPAPSSSPRATSSTSTAAATSAQSGGGAGRVVLDPNHGGVGTVVHVTGSGYGPGLQLSGTLCAVDAKGAVENPFTDCDIVDVVTVTTDTHGGFTTTFTVKSIPPAKAGYQIGFGVPSASGQSAGAAFTVDGR